MTMIHDPVYLAARAVRNADRGCPAWCAGIHEEPNEPHYGDLSEYLIHIDGLNSGANASPDILGVGLDQREAGGEVMISMGNTFGTMWLPLQEAKRLAIRLLQLDLDANGVAGR